MKGYCITFRSVTYAQQGSVVLRRAGVYGQLQRTPKWMEEQGCGYCIQVRTQDGEAAVAALRRAGTTFRKIYRLGSNGEAGEVLL